MDYRCAILSWFTIPQFINTGFFTLKGQFAQVMTPTFADFYGTWRNCSNCYSDDIIHNFSLFSYSSSVFIKFEASGM